MDNEEVDLEKIIDDQELETGKLNIIITGKTGVGKSTLINAVFGDDIAEVGTGKPVTQNTQCHTKEDKPLAIYDTKGLELDNMSEIAGELENLIKEHKTNKPKDHIHIAWYCVNCQSKRIEDAEIDFIKRLSQSVKVILILTQTWQKNSDMRAEVLKLLPNIAIAEVMAQDAEFPTGKLAAWGLDDLVKETYDLIPECIQNAFVVAQQINKQMKIDAANKAVKIAAASAAAIGATPIPFSDAALLVPVQMGMVVAICKYMDVKMDKTALKALLTTVIGQTGTTLVGRAIVAGLLKLIPVAGSVVGGAISAATASAVTYALGKGLIFAISYIQDSGLEMTPQVLAKIYIETMKTKQFKQEDEAK